MHQRNGGMERHTGSEPELSFHYNGDSSHGYRQDNEQDKTHLVLGVHGTNKFARGWQLSGEAELRKGSHDRNITAALMLQRVW